MGDDDWTVKKATYKYHKNGQYDSHLFWASQYWEKSSLDNLPRISFVWKQKNGSAIFSPYFKTANVFLQLQLPPLAGVLFCIINACE